MGSASRKKPKRLAEKLLQIRVSLSLSQNEMLNRLNLDETLTRIDISKYERGIREPSLVTLLEYARTINVSTDILIDDKADLP
jgi:transcriptional regulator with XRE-family HTH domain